MWAELVVQAGAVRFVDESSGKATIATPDNGVVIVPDRKHHVEPQPGAEFHVQFYVDAGVDPDTEADNTD